MTTKTKRKKTPKPTTEKLIALEIEPRLKVTGILTIQQLDEKWGAAYDVRDSKTKEAFYLEFTPESYDYDSEAEVIRECFLTLRQWCEDVIEGHPSEERRMLEVIAALKKQEAKETQTTWGLSVDPPQPASGTMVPNDRPAWKCSCGEWNDTLEVDVCQCGEARPGSNKKKPVSNKKQAKGHKAQPAKANRDEDESQPAAPRFDVHAVRRDLDRWMYRRLADVIEKLPKKDRATPLKILLAISGTESVYEITGNRRAVAEVLDVAVPEGTGFFRINDLWVLLEKLTPDQTDRAVRRFCATALREQANEYWLELFPEETLQSICGLVGIDLHKEWIPTTEVLEHYPLAMLVTTAAAKRIEEDDPDNFAELAGSKETLIPALIAEWTPGEMPPGLEVTNE